VNWKRRHLNKRFYGANKEDVAKAIAEDVAFLAAHPTRTKEARS
jgi:hypothetical protein